MALLPSLLVIWTIVSSVLAQKHHDGDAAVCCSVIAKALPHAIQMPSSSLYEDTNERYYLQAQADLDPTCRVLPSSAKEVAKIVKIAAEYQCQFAVASGKHFQINRGSNIGREGFTIDLLYLNAMSVSKDKSVVSIGPGLRAGQVYDYLDRYDLYTAVGRDKDVGIGGFLIGGGSAFPTFEHGFGSNVAVNFEVVLASGEVVNVNEKSNKDLFWAIKAGSTNYGIVTRYDLMTFPSPTIWGGFLGFPMSESKAFLGNYVKALEYLSKHPSEAGSMLITFDSRSEDLVLTQAHYRNHGEEFPPLYDILVENDPEIHLNTLGVKTLLEFVDSVAVPTSVENMRWHTFNMKLDGDFVVQVYKKGQQLFGNLNATVPGLYYTTVVQPMFSHMRCATYAGPVCDEGADDLIMILLQVYWDNSKDDKKVLPIVEAWKEWTTKETKKRGIHSDYIYLNYMGNTEDSPYTGLQRKSLEKMLTVQEKYDPDEVYKNLWKGGHKLPSHA